MRGFLVRRTYAVRLGLSALLVFTAAVILRSPISHADCASGYANGHKMGCWDHLSSRWPDIMIHSALVRGQNDTSRVVWWGEDPTNIDSTYSWDVRANDPLPASGGLWRQLVGGTAIFCGGNSTLPDGKLLVTGGDNGVAPGTVQRAVYDPTYRSWSLCPSYAGALCAPR
jgi:hypothetical protein